MQDSVGTPHNQVNSAHEQVCKPWVLLLIAVASLASGVATNKWLFASSQGRYSGQVQVESLLVRAPVDGILQSWEVEEGSAVDPNILLCRIGGSNLLKKIQIQTQEVARLDARLRTLQAEIDVKLHQHVRELDGDIYQAELQTADLLQKKYYYEIEAMAWRDSQESNQMQKKSALDTPNYDLKPNANITSGNVGNEEINSLLKEEAAINAAEATEAQLEICNARLIKLQEQKKQVEERVRDAVGISEAELELEQAKLELTQLELQLEQQQVHSTVLGTVANFRRRPGEFVQAGEVLADLYRMDESYVVAEIPTTDSHQFDVEMPVKCRFPNGEVRTGVVTKVAIAANAVAQSDVPTVPLRIEQTGALWPKMPVGGLITITR